MVNANNLVAQKKKIIRTCIVIVFIILFTIGVLFIMNYFNLIPKEHYKANDFDIKTIYSKKDFDKDNIDDYTDFVLGARKDAEKHPKYVSKYYDNGFPPSDEGVCTDVIWRAFKHAGYDLREMVDQDIKLRPKAYPNIKNRDKNIDFRRVENLKIYFSHNSIHLTTDYHDITSWQPGDIVIFEDKHIGVISDYRNKEGIPYVIHNNNQPKREEDYLTKSKITAHYRFDATKIDEKYLIKWSD